MISFEYATATRIVFGPGSAAKLGPLIRGLGRRTLLVTGGTSERIAGVVEQLIAAGVEISQLSISGEPTVDAVEACIVQARESGCEVVVSVGGGSAIDAGKAIAVMVNNPGTLLDYLEVIGLGKTHIQPGVPFVAVPTTAGTGSEVTRNAVISSPAHGVKVSLRSPLMLARLAVVDPDLTLSLPAGVTASTGMDALAQLIEPYTSVSPNPVVDLLALDGIHRIRRSLTVAFNDGHDRSARYDMSLASMFSGMCLANAPLGAVHGFAAPVGGVIPAPHGAICARLLPIVMQANITAIEKGRAAPEWMERYKEIARILTGDERAQARDGVARVYKLRELLKIRPLSAYGLTLDDIGHLVEKSARASSMKGNPVKLSAEEMEQILLEAF